MTEPLISLKHVGKLFGAGSEDAVMLQIGPLENINLKGLLLGGIIIGCIQQISDNRIGTEWTPAIVFAYLVLIMVFRPQGLLGEETREAG